MLDPGKLEGVEYPSHYAGVLKSLREFDRIEIEGVLSSLFGITKREECFYVLYLRTQRNIDTLLELKHVAHFQAIAMLGRALFEIRLDIELLARDKESDVRMRAYKSLELLRIARAIVKHEDAQSSGPYKGAMSEKRKYVAEAGPLIEGEVSRLWPGRKEKSLKHWSTLNVSEHAKSLGPDTEAMYIASYQHFSWYVHAGLQGTLDAPADHFPRICGMALCLAAISYRTILGVIAREVRLTLHNQDFEKKLELALSLPKTESSEDQIELIRWLGL